MLNEQVARIDLEGPGSVFHALGDVDNGGLITTDFNGGGDGNNLNIDGNLANGGTFQLFGLKDMSTIGSLTNAGTVDVEKGSTLTISGAADNSGIMETNANGYGGGNTITVNGLLTNEATGQINLNGPGDVLQALAGLSNSGVINVKNGSSIDPPFLNNGGTIKIDSTSRLVVGTPTPMGGQGYIQLHNGTLTEIINGSAFGVINVTGSALLDGTLAILLQGSTPAYGSEYKFLIASPGELSGEFSNVPNPDVWGLTYDYADGYVEAKFIPEPATLLVLIPGLLGAGYGLRRHLLK